MRHTPHCRRHGEALLSLPPRRNGIAIYVFATSVPVLLHGFAAFATTRFAAKESFVGDYSKTFDWIEFPEGRVRYVGQKRGREEPPIDVFSVNIQGWTYFGEIRRSYLADRNHYDLEVASFGWLHDDWFGTEPDPAYCASFSVEQLAGVQRAVVQAVAVWYAMNKRPALLYTSEKSCFTGDIRFLGGWALVKDDENGKSGFFA